MAEGLDLGKPVGGVPVGVWVVGGTAVVGGAWFLMRRKSSSSSSSTQSGNQPTTIYAPATSGDFSTDQAQAIFSDIRNLQGQETTFSDTASQLNQGIAGVSNQVTGVSNQVTNVGQQIGKIPAGPSGPPGPPGPAGTPGAPPPPPPPPPPVYRPTRHIAQVPTDGKHSINFYASAYGTSVANILGQTAISESSDYNRPSSALHRYVTRGAWSNVVPAGFTLYVPYVR